MSKNVQLDEKKWFTSVTWCLTLNCLGVFTFTMWSKVKSSLRCIALPRNVSVGVTFCISAQTLQGVALLQRYLFFPHRLLTNQEVLLKTIAHVSLLRVGGVAASSWSEGWSLSPLRGQQDCWASVKIWAQTPPFHLLLPPPSIQGRVRPLTWQPTIVCLCLCHWNRLNSPPSSLYNDQQKRSHQKNTENHYTIDALA